MGLVWAIRLISSIFDHWLERKANKSVFKVTTQRIHYLWLKSQPFTSSILRSWSLLQYEISKISSNFHLKQNKNPKISKNMVIFYISSMLFSSCFFSLLVILFQLDKPFLLYFYNFRFMYLPLTPNKSGYSDNQ